jgi:hypothetical protein
MAARDHLPAAEPPCATGRAVLETRAARALTGVRRGGHLAPQDAAVLGRDALAHLDVDRLRLLLLPQHALLRQQLLADLRERAS